MKLLLIQYAQYIPSLGGSNKSNKLMLEALAARGHQCRSVSLASIIHGEAGRHELLQVLREKKILLSDSHEGVDSFLCDGVAVFTAWDTSHLCREVLVQIREFRPDWVLVSSEDPSQILLKTVLQEAPDRVIYLAHTTLALPCGPDSFSVNPASATLLRRATAVITVSEYLRNYLHEWGSVDSVVLPILLYGSDPFLNLGCFDRGYITIVNPCAVKGIDIFIELARRMTHLEFAAVLSWGATAEDIRILHSVPNVRIVPFTENINDIWRMTRILLVPSVWAEGRGRIITEAMASGIPVVASNTGGIPEAKLGVPFVIPVNPVKEYEYRLDERRIPVPIVPKQDVKPWEECINRLTQNRSCYEENSNTSRRIARQYISQQDIGLVEVFLENLRRPAVVKTDPSDGNKANYADDILATISPAKRALLARRLAERKVGKRTPNQDAKI